jgi:cob(I)alamin adenosyltransferase
MMSISTKKGDSGYTNLLRGERVPKHHLAIEAGGTLDEVNSFLGLARAASKEKRLKRIILQVQRHLFIIGAELSVPKGGRKSPKKKISETDIQWLERLVEEFEESLELPPGFVTFGQKEGSSYLDVARTSVRKMERMAARMKNRNMIENSHILKYLNRLSDLVFLLACFEEKDGDGKRKIKQALFSSQLTDPLFRKWGIATGLIILVLIATIIFILIFHKATPQNPYPYSQKHMEQMENMHKLVYRNLDRSPGKGEDR